MGIINADFIQTVDFFSGSFPAAKYNALSGVFDFKQKNGSMDKTNVQATLEASETALTLDGPVGKEGSYIFSVRRSYLQFLFSAIGLPFLPTFNDYQFKYKTNLNKRDQLTIISLGSLDHLSLNDKIENPDASQEYILAQIPVNNQWSYTIGAVYKHFIEHGFHTFVASRNMLNNEFYKYPDNDESKPKILNYNSTEAENKFRYELSLQKADLKYNFSANAEYAKYFNETQQQIFSENTLTQFAYQTQFNMFKYGISGQVTKSLFKESLILNLGVRFDSNNYNENMANLLNQFSPRFSISYQLGNKTMLNAGTGRFFQLPAYTSLGYRNATGSLVNEDIAEYIGANHYNLGFEYRVSKAVKFSVEGFYKDYFQYPHRPCYRCKPCQSGRGLQQRSGCGSAHIHRHGRGSGF